MSNIFLETWFKYAPCLRHFVIMCDCRQRNKFRCYNIIRACGSVASVRDTSMPDSIKEKIFQPLLTTKPTRQGTGLGLSLSYDIVKAHGGELKVETKEGRRLRILDHTSNCLGKMKPKFLLFFLSIFPLLDVSGQIREHEIAELKKTYRRQHPILSGSTFLFSCPTDIVFQLSMHQIQNHEG